MADPVGQSPFLSPTQQPAAAPAPALGALMQPAPVQQGPPPQTQADLDTKASGWDTFFSNPAVATALFQFGINLLSPQRVGQTEGGHIGAALGAAGEAAGRVASKQFETDVVRGREARETQRVGLEGRRVASEEARTQTDAQRAVDEAKWRQQWLAIQQQQVRISAMSAGAAGASNALAQQRLASDIKIADERIKLERDKLAHDWLQKNVDRTEKSDTALLSRMYSDVMRTPRLPDEPPPDIGKIGQDFMTLRGQLQSVKKGADVFELGTEQQWRQMLGNPTLKQQAIDTFGSDIVTRAEKKLQDIDKGTGAPAGPL